MLPLGCEAALNPATAFRQVYRVGGFATAAHSSGSKLPRHSFGVCFSSGHNNLFHLVGSAEYAFRLLRKRYS
ncbi:hypothetical protein C1Y08_22210 [Pseudomonas sp. FW306-02-F02-AA]|nr:hypothetical protein C1Y07_18550 [Pseudomonas sp. FW306-02-F02-AB]PMZ08347.1 hypothetical protein C1Y06_19430 [Pseudomonas sp. FW306-02-H06C]PMZ13699.1 hypothetical protein C1Y08_22210 [Pseudomonas sp. FW306-02-F02-AA]PMZ22791.1 hypothetical protein C1Y09_06865 [Pseudomonas sp. FW306-02-F08-AA]PMZ26086.1 hypothetical protein C1Y05_19790 [Pseudomonas sp. FW306-02-F04-BA]PMZ32128.1 hypothetical protein C1X99_22705 [Pseudomonas sp. FW306-02-H06B]PMZ37968.1 hypothetical protein C1Y00_24410 [Ps